jgi:hypothetical protein
MIREDIMVIVLEELRGSNERTWTAGDALDQKANFVFAGGSVIVGILAALLYGRGMENICAVLWGIIVSAVVLYLILTILFLVVISPRRFRTALREDKDTIENEMFGREHQVALLSIIEGYIETISFNRNVNQTKVKGVRWSALIMAFLVILLVLFGALS